MRNSKRERRDEVGDYEYSTPAPVTQVYSDATAMRHALDGFKVIARFESKTSSSIHTVESDGTGKFPSGYRCTCQGFKIHKKGFCKHTKQVYAEGKK